MQVQIRRCRLEDAAAIYQLNKEQMGYDYPLHETTEKISLVLAKDSDQILVAEVDQAVVGYVHLCDYDVLYTPHLKNIMGIAVAKNYQKQGIGKALLSAAENWAQETGAVGIRLVSGAERSEAHTFYQLCGYQKMKQQYNFKKLF